MGPRAKYFTNAERVAARRAQHALYAKSDRGKAARARSKAKATRRLASASTTISNRVSIPDAMYAQVSRRTPPSNTTLADDGPDLGLRHAPYTFAMLDADDIEDNRGDATLNVNLHTLQRGWLMREGAARFELWSTLTDDKSEEIVEAGVTELNARIRAWNSLAADERWTALGAMVREVYLHWGAKRVIWLAEELDSRRQGCEAYVAAYGDIPSQGTQCANVPQERGLSLEHPDDEDDLLYENYE
ncbi:hypothetical protein OH76DRAFT_1489281 [Lentinus brumalis]|uniref:Uncharacterized protein n=1 Tax=Lentinus brumalis TaxID=2498619 RepID=A0A371CN54_9APHY|nr:hypothetical protein OH76DRAFT_1489281 [Polyporus brumalis]